MSEHVGMYYLFAGTTVAWILIFAFTQKMRGNLRRLEEAVRLLQETSREP
ncbi:MAG: CcmD family protein [Thermaerobacter sp.]|nr:CcmD family protein [Thermaerobacter sp.]MDA8146043.1 CcmD family protein [Thermaerobacter sp.]